MRFPLVLAVVMATTMADNLWGGVTGDVASDVGTTLEEEYQGAGLRYQEEAPVAPETVYPADPAHYSLEQVRLQLPNNPINQV